MPSDRSAACAHVEGCMARMSAGRLKALCDTAVVNLQSSDRCGICEHSQPRADPWNRITVESCNREIV